MAIKPAEPPKDPYVYLGCPRCLRILRLDGLPLVDFLCNFCYEEIFKVKKTIGAEKIYVREEKEEVSLSRYLAIRQEITLERVVSFSCNFLDRESPCGGPRIFFRGLSLCYKCHRDHYAPGIYILDPQAKGGKRYILIGGLLPLGETKTAVVFQKNRKDFAEAVFLQQGGEAFIFEQVYPLDGRFKIYYVWPTEFRKPDIFDKL